MADHIDHGHFDPVTGLFIPDEPEPEAEPSEPPSFPPMRPSSFPRTTSIHQPLERDLDDIPWGCDGFGTPWPEEE